jgi:hypothetical protein
VLPSTYLYEYTTGHEQQNKKMGGYLGCHCLYSRVSFLIVSAIFKAIVSIPTHASLNVNVNNNSNINSETKRNQNNAFAKMYGSL